MMSWGDLRDLQLLLCANGCGLRDVQAEWLVCRVCGARLARDSQQMRRRWQLGNWTPGQGGVPACGVP
jgi:hypothetical protein